MSKEFELSVAHGAVEHQVVVEIDNQVVTFRNTVEAGDYFRALADDVARRFHLIGAWSEPAPAPDGVVDEPEADDADDLAPTVKAKAKKKP